ncbi:hypothetical protein EST38_g511 [Candolleomyces aberdarensis]|uniref:Peptidase A1 domain-containing protein n=1 Tax=Candolleomyces aberdarensis TaxID=2316362 RepID=A0A4V1Q5E7_9AGAR|nr:hypothetical protein EST38_g511 [Candolleomyces aberdarensis]
MALSSLFLALLLFSPLSHSLTLTVRAPIELSNQGDLSYYADLTLNGRVFNVLVDTGSADLWVAGAVLGATDTGYRGSFGNHTVPNQAFIEVAPSSIHPEGHGILGLGPSTGSFITDLVPTGTPLLSHLFSLNRTTPNFFTILLGRERDPTDHYTGSLTIGEVLPDRNAILDQPRINIVKLPPSRQDQQHLQVLLDRDGLLGPDGQVIPMTSVVSQMEDKSRMTVVLDSGFSLPQVPRAVADALYSRFHGAEFVTVNGIGPTYILPCDAEVNATFVFSGRQYPMHPLDMTMDPSVLGLGSVVNSRGELACVATFQPFTYDRGANPTYDMVLGMAFMRNVYTLFDYGDFTSPNDTSSSTIDPPYIQLLSLTDPSEGHRDFVTVRLGGIDTPPRGLTPSGTNTNQDEDNNSNSNSKNNKHVYAIIGSVVRKKEQESTEEGKRKTMMDADAERLGDSSLTHRPGPTLF